MNGLDISTFVLLVAILTMTLSLFYFTSRQNTASESRLRSEMREMETRRVADSGAMETRLINHMNEIGARLDQRIGDTNQRIDRIDQRIDGIDQRMDRIDQRFDDINTDNRIIINDLGMVKGRLDITTTSRERTTVTAE